MARPRWIALLALALAVAAAFAALSQWQLSRAVESGQVAVRPTETVVALADVATPDQPIREAAEAQLVAVTGHYAAADYVVIEDRLNDGESGYWVTGHLIVDQPGRPSLAVALGWTRTREQAETVAEQLAARTSEVPQEIAGRLVPTEAPALDEEHPRRLTTMAVPALINMWSSMGAGSVYTAYVIASEPPAGLTAIYSPPPVEEIELNWLNIFYAIEWVVFAGFAVFLWYRLAHDAWKREIEEAEAAPEREAAHSDAP